MALYLGSSKFKTNINGVLYYVNLFSTIPIVNGIALLSSDNYMLKDKNGLYITAKQANIAGNVVVLDNAKLDATILA